jgi:hypothetical protein
MGRRATARCLLLQSVVVKRMAGWGRGRRVTKSGLCDLHACAMQVWSARIWQVDLVC